MIRYEVREERSSLGNVLRPVADVILERDAFKSRNPDDILDTLPKYKMSHMRSSYA